MTRTILNLSGYAVEHVEETEHDYRIRAVTLGPRFACLCGSTSATSWGTHEQLVRDLPMHGKRVGIYVLSRRFRCNDCGKTGMETLPHVSERRAMTDRLERWMGKQSMGRTFASVADEVGVDERTVRNVFRDHVADLEQDFRFEAPKWLGIDEIHLIRKPRPVFSNIEQSTIVNILRDRNKRTVVAYLRALEGRERIRYVAMDMWNPYREAVAALLPQATVVIDKFHVLKMADTSLESVRKALRAKLAAKERRGLMHDRFLLLKRQHELTDQQRFLVDSWSKLHPDLGEAYRLKERFYALYDAEDRHEAARAYATWAASIPPSLRSAFAPIITAFKSWHEPILAYFDHPVTNVYSESLHALIRVMDRLGRGYSFEALRAKMLYTQRLHKRASAAGISAFALMTDENANMRAMPDDGPKINYGTDIPTLAERFESGRF